MKILSPEEVSVLGFAKFKIQAAIYTLEVGQGLEITNLEWNLKTKTPTLAYMWAKKKGIKVSVQRTPAGWLVVRIA